MSNYNSLKATIDANIKQNGNQEITGQILNSVLNAMVTTLGTGYQFAGVATIATNPGTPDAKVFYIANGKGTYEKFGGLEVTEDDVVVFYWDTAWHKVATGIASDQKLSKLDRELGQVIGDEEKIILDSEVIGTTNAFFSVPCSIPVSVGDKVYVNVPDIPSNETFRIYLWDNSNLLTTSADLTSLVQRGQLNVNTSGNITRISIRVTNSSITYSGTIRLYKTEGSISSISGRIGTIIGKQIEIERGGISASGNLSSYNAGNSVRTKPIFVEGSLIVRINVGIIFNGTIFKYKSGVFVGSQTFSVDRSLALKLINDGTFDSIAILLERGAALTDEMVQGVSIYAHNETAHGIYLQSEVDDLYVRAASGGVVVGFEQGSINYLNGNNNVNNKCIRTGSIDIQESAKIILDIPIETEYGYMIKYKDSVYVGYSKLHFPNQNNVVNIIKDETFNKVRFRIDSKSEWSSDDIANTNLVIAFSSGDYYKIISNTESLYRKSSLTEGGYIHKDSGKLIMQGNGYFYTEFIPVRKNGSFKYAMHSYGQSMSICGYDKDKNFVSAIISGEGIFVGEMSIENPSIAYLRGCTNNAYDVVITTLHPIYDPSEGFDRLNVNTLSVSDIDMNGEQKEATGFLSIESQQSESRWYKLENNFAFPDDGVFIGRIGNDVYVSVFGKLTKINQ